MQFSLAQLTKQTIPFYAICHPNNWRKPKDHCQDCYFCFTKTKGLFFKQQDKITYPNLDSARTPVPHDEPMPPSMFPKDGPDAIDSSGDEDYRDEVISVNSTDSEYNSTKNLTLFSQKHLK